MAEIASAYVSILPSFKGTAATLDKGMSGAAASAGKTTGSRFGKTFSGSALAPIKGLVAGMGVLFAAQKITGLFKDSIAEAREAQVVTGRTESVIKSMGLTSTVTAAEIGRMAMSISNKTAVDDEAIQSGQNLLLTFKNVASSAGESNGVFAQTSQLMVDMSAAMGTDAKSSAIQLGKALNDPVKGITALTRVGVSFTEQQQDQIKALTESGDLLGAQKIILGELKNQFGGAAASMSTPAERAAVAWANFKEQIGSALLPVIDRLLTLLSGKVIPAISKFVSQMQLGTGVGGQFATAFRATASALSTVVGFINQHRVAMIGLASAITAVVVITKIHTAVLAVQAAGGLAAMVRSLPIVINLTRAWAAMQWVLNAALSANPVALVVVAIAALVAGLVLAYQKSETFRAVVDGVFSFLKSAVTAVVSFIGDHWKLIVILIGGPIAAVALLVVKHWTAIKNFVTTAVSAVINFVRDHWRLIITIIGGPLGLAVALVTKHWNTIKSATSAAWNAVKSAISAAINAAKTIVSTQVELIKSIVTRGGTAIVSTLKSIPGKVLSLAGEFLSAGKTLGSKVIDGIFEGLRAAGGLASDLASAIRSAINSGLHLPFTIHGPGPLPDFTIPAFARGTLSAPGGLALVGEEGPELVNLPRGAQVHTAAQTRAMSRGFGGGLTNDAVIAELRALRAAVGRQGRDFGREINSAATAGSKGRTA